MKRKSPFRATCRNSTRIRLIRELFRSAPGPRLFIRALGLFILWVTLVWTTEHTDWSQKGALLLSTAQSDAPYPSSAEEVLINLKKACEGAAALSPRRRLFLPEEAYRAPVALSFHLHLPNSPVEVPPRIHMVPQPVFPGMNRLFSNTPSPRPAFRPGYFSRPPPSFA